jgi:hypothetical protein
MRIFLLGSMLALSGCLTTKWASAVSIGSTGCFENEMTVTREPTLAGGVTYYWELECQGAHFVCSGYRDVSCTERRVAPKPAQ